MRITRATRAAVTISSPTCHDTEDDDPTPLWQKSLADLLHGAAQHIATPSVVVLQTNDWKGLSQVVEQSPMDYALTLLGCGIVSVNESKSIRNKVEVHEDKLKEMLGRRRLMTEKESSSDCWVSKGRVYEGALKEKRPADAPPVSETKAADMVTLRIGKIAHGGKAPPGAKHINGRKDRPKFSWKMRKVLTKYQRTIRPLVTKAYFDEKMRSDARIVAQWMVDPPQLFKRKEIKRRVNPQAKQPTKDTPNSPPKKKVNTAATPKRGTKDVEANDEEIMSQQLQDDLMDVFRKHGLLDKLKQQLPQDDLKQASSTTPKQSSATTAFVTPFHAVRPSEEPREEQTSTSVDPTTDITDPPQMNNVSPSESEKKQFPVLSKLAPRVLQRDRDCVGGMDMDQILCDAILREIVKFKSNRGETVGFESANSHSSHTLLDVPFIDKDNKKVPDMNRVLTQVMSMAEKGSERIMVDAVIDHLVKSHNAATREVLRERKITHRNMDQYDLATILDVLQMKSWQMEGLQQCLKQFLDVDKVSVAKDKVQALSEGYGDITHGTYYYTDPNKPGTTAEEVRYWWKDPVIETVASVTGLVNGYNLTPEDISFIHAVYGGDHRKGKFRFCGKVVIRTKDGKYYDDVFGLADVACKKDNGIVLDATVLPHLMEGINVMETSGFVFHTVNDDGSITYQIDTTEQPAPTTALPLQYYLKPTCFIAGDLAFLAIIMGKEGFASSWCNWCDLDHNEWAKKDHSRGTLWTYERIEEQHEENKAQEWDDERRKGIRRTPYTKIPFNRIIFSVLHAMIGVGDLIITHLEEFVDGEIEELDPIEMQMRNELTNKSEARAEAHEEWEHWKQSELGGKLLAKKQRRVRYINTISMKKVDAIINNNDLTEQERTDASAAKEALTAEKADIVNAIPALVAQGKTRKKVWEELDTEISALKAKLRECTKERRTSEDSYYTGMDRIFQDEGANRAAHFGRKFNGVNLRTIMEKAGDLFGDEGRIRQYLLEKAPAKENLINEKCNDIRDALVLWDAAFSKLRTVDPTPDDCNKAQQLIDVAVAQLRKMDISITPKVHGTQYHAVYQMRTIPGGIAKLGEDWIEKYHQDGFRYDFCYGRVGDLERQAVIRARCEHRARNPQVVMRKELLAKRFKGKRKKKSTTVKEVQKQIKEEKRHEVLLRKLEEDVVELY